MSFLRPGRAPGPHDPRQGSRQLQPVVRWQNYYVIFPGFNLSNINLGTNKPKYMIIPSPAIIAFHNIVAEKQKNITATTIYVVVILIIIFFQVAFIDFTK
jgi:hypothetical protein